MYMCICICMYICHYKPESTALLSTRKLLRCANHGQLLGACFGGPELRSAFYKNEK